MKNNVDLTTFADAHPITLFQIKTVALCGCLMLIDGLDNQMISYMAPHIATEFALSKSELGTLFSVGLAGTMAGYLLVSPWSERIGHKPVILLSTCALGILNLIGPYVHGLSELSLLRFLIGINLGAVLPSTIVLTSLYSPKRLRASNILLMMCFLSFGFVIAGVISAWIIPTFGWRGMFWLGGLAPLALAPLMMAGLPESPSYIAGRGEEGRRKAISYLRRIDPNIADGATLIAVTETDRKAVAQLASIFRDNRAVGTLLLWLAFMLNGALGYALQSWLPTMLTVLARSSSDIVAATSLNAVGGILIAIVIGPAMDRLGPYIVLSILYLVGSCFLLLLGWALTGTTASLLIACLLSGACVFGGQKAIIALSALFYPLDLRGVGSGWALASARVGAIIGPFFVGAGMSQGFKPQAILAWLSLPMLMLAFVVIVMRKHYARSASQSA